MNKVINKVKQLQKDVDNAMKTLKESFNEELLKFMIENKIDSFSLGINNHEFNDGDRTYFSLYYEDLEIDDLTNEQNEKITNFFSLFDVDGFYENMFGDKYEAVTFSVKNNELTIE
jgi:hypothetical protein